MKLLNITDVFFDLDHTLWDFEKNSAAAFKTIFTNHQLLYALDDFLLVYPEINKKYWEMYRINQISHQQLRYNRLKDSFDCISVELTDDTIYLIANNYIEQLPKYNVLMPGAKDILSYLDKKYKLHIITNGLHEVQHLKLINSGILEYFDTVVDSETIGVKKPNPQIFEYAIQIANAQTQNCVMIGDCIEADINGALNVGMKAILLDETEKNNVQNIILINNLHQLKNYL